VTEQQPKHTEIPGPKLVFSRVGVPRRTNREAIVAGLEFIFSRQEGKHWTDFTILERNPDIWVTAYVLARLADIPSDAIPRDFSLRREQSLDWLMGACTPEGLWGASCGLEADADTTARTVIALRQYGREAPQSAVEFIRSCQRANGGFAAYPETSRMDGLYRLSTPETTVVAIKALASRNLAAEDFLAARVQEDASSSWSRLTSRFQLCSEILSMDEGLVPWFLLNKISQCTAQYPGDSAFDQSLLLRCLFALRMQRAWPESARLRNLQLQDGSWPAAAVLGPAMPGAAVRQKPHVLITDDKRVLTTATALSALAMGEGQPGLYFGSDLPQPRRFTES
jgi:hypothetical protein